jgi:hypothetical protein
MGRLPTNDSGRGGAFKKEQLQPAAAGKKAEKGIPFAGEEFEDF